MELFVLGLVFGAATAQGKAVTKAVAKGYLTVSDKTREVVSTLREDMRGAIEEARTEREQDESESDIAVHDAEVLALREEASPVDLKPKQPVAATRPLASATGSTATAVPTSSVAAKQSPTVMKSLAKKYMAMTEKTRDAVSGIRENVRDAIEEARYERELAAQRTNHAESEAAAPADEVIFSPDVAPVTKRTRSKGPATRTKALVASTSTRKKSTPTTVVTETPKPRKSTRTQSAAAKTPADTPAPTNPTVIPAKRSRPRENYRSS